MKKKEPLFQTRYVTVENLTISQVGIVMTESLLDRTSAVSHNLTKRIKKLGNKRFIDNIDAKSLESMHSSFIGIQLEIEDILDLIGKVKSRKKKR